MPSEQNLTEFRFLGRGGQGVVTAAELLARAGAYEGRKAQSIPYFGAERRGAQVIASARISDRRIWTREPVTTPDAVVVLDHSLLKEGNALDGMKSDGCLILNTTMSPHDVARQLNEKRKNGTELPARLQIWAVDATGIAMKLLKKPMTSALMLGAIFRAKGLISLDSIKRAVVYRFPKEDIAISLNAIEEVAKSCSCACTE